MSLNELYDCLGFYTVQLENAQQDQIEFIESEINRILKEIEDLEKNGQT